MFLSRSVLCLICLKVTFSFERTSALFYDESDHFLRFKNCDSWDCYIHFRQNFECDYVSIILVYCVSKIEITQKILVA